MSFHEFCLTLSLEQIDIPLKKTLLQHKDYRYTYGLTIKQPASFGNSLSKMDVKQGTFKRWHEPGCIPTEALMIPRPGAENEARPPLISAIRLPGWQHSTCYSLDLGSRRLKVLCYVLSILKRQVLNLQDDGVVTSLVTGADGKSFLLVLDAGSFQEIARAYLPYGIAYGFHNQFHPA